MKGKTYPWPLRLTQSTDELKQLIKEHPGYPIVVLAGESANSGDFSWMYCTDIKFKIAEVLNCEAPFQGDIVYSEHDDFEDDLANWLWNKTDHPEKLSDEEWSDMLHAEIEKYEPFWQKCIAIYADN